MNKKYILFLGKRKDVEMLHVWKRNLPCGEWVEGGEDGNWSSMSGATSAVV